MKRYSKENKSIACEANDKSSMVEVAYVKTPLRRRNPEVVLKVKFGMTHTISNI